MAILKIYFYSSAHDKEKGLDLTMEILFQHLLLFSDLRN